MQAGGIADSALFRGCYAGNVISHREKVQEVSTFGHAWSRDRAESCGKQAGSEQVLGMRAGVSLVNWVTCKTKKDTLP